MVSLHKIIEQSKNQETRFIPGKSFYLDQDQTVLSPTESEKKDRDKWRVVEKQAHNAICFDLGEIDNWLKVQGSRVIDRIPFPICWFEFSCEEVGIKRGLLLWEHEPVNKIRLIEGVFFVSDPDFKGWKLQQTFAFDPTQNNDDFKIKLSFSFSEQEINMHQFGMFEFFRVVRYFVDVQSCNNVFLFKNEAPAKLNKKRIKNGKVPIFSYWTLNIDLGKTNNRKNPQGGTHASPRVHLRRGHMREYKPGKFTWVQPMVVGNKKKGVVMKDYKVNPFEKRVAL